MKKIVMLFAMLLVVGSANSATAVTTAGTSSFISTVGGALPYAGLVGFGYFVATDTAKPALACASEPIRKVAWANNPKGYSFTVAGCDYQAKKDQLVEVK